MSDTTILSNFIIIHYVGVILLIALLCLINPQKVNKSGNRWFGICMLCIFSTYLYDTIPIAGMKTNNDIIIRIFNFPGFMFAPAFYYAVSYFITPDRPWKIKDYFHLFSLALLYISILLCLIFYVKGLTGFEQVPNILILRGIFLIICCIQVFYYSLLSWVKLKKHQDNIRLFTSTIENVDLRWLKHIVVCTLIMFIFFIISALYNFSGYYLIIMQLSYLIGFFSVAYFFIKQKEIYPFTTEQKNEIIYTIIKDTSTRQEPKKLIEEDKLEELKKALLHIMVNNKPFLDYELNLVKLASVIDISSHELSYLINTGFSENFYQFINRYRIEEAKKLILDENKNYLSFQGIGLEVGFKSRSVFNTTFRKYTGKTPSEYKTVNKKNFIKSTQT